MTQRKVNALLLVGIIVMAMCPLFGALYFVDNALTTSLNLGFNSDVIGALDSSADRLKTLGKLDPENREAYRQEFERVASLKAVYSSGEVIKQSLRHSLLIYFAVGVLAVLVVSVLVATLLSRKISQSFRATFEDLARNRERVRSLEELTSWQELAKMLAHEIKNPLTPIEVMVTSLREGYRDQSSIDFAEQLVSTETMVLEELTHLKKVVNKFSDFAKLPAVQLADTEIKALLDQHVAAIGMTFESARITVACVTGEVSARANVDATLFRQVVVNIVRNGLDANPDRIVDFTCKVFARSDSIQIRIANNGVPVPSAFATRIFDPYISSGAKKDNMGLGLAIVRKIILEHGGDIAYEERDGHPEFIVDLPRLTT